MDKDITRLVVGDKIRLALGEPVHQAQIGAQDLTPANAMRWSGGKWETEGIDRLHEPVVKPTDTLVISRDTWFIGIGALIFISTIVVAPIVVKRNMSTGFVDVPVASGAAANRTQPKQAVQTVNEPFPVPDDFLAGNKIEKQPVRRTQATAVLRETTPIPSVQLPKEISQAPVAAQKSAPTENRTNTAEESKAGAPSVILDAETQTKTAGVIEPDKDEREPLPHAKVVPVVPRKLPKGSGLVAISPDGKTALFTDPQTRLPVQFKVGDKLVGGDTIASINQQAGKVLSDKFDYRLE